MVSPLHGADDVKAVDVACRSLPHYPTSLTRIRSHRMNQDGRVHRAYHLQVTVPNEPPLCRSVRLIQQLFQVLWMLVQVAVHFGKHLNVGMAKDRGSRHGVTGRNQQVAGRRVPHNIWRKRYLHPLCHPPATLIQIRTSPRCTIQLTEDTPVPLLLDTCADKGDSTIRQGSTPAVFSFP